MSESSSEEHVEESNTGGEERPACCAKQPWEAVTRRAPWLSCLGGVSWPRDCLQTACPEKIKRYHTSLSQEKDSSGFFRPPLPPLPQTFMDTSIRMARSNGNVIFNTQ